MDFEQFSDEQIAFLTYASEVHFDRLRRDSTVMRCLTDAGAQLKEALNQEYCKRHLHREHFHKGGVK